ncbi:MAG: hypothetical protein JWN34_3931 [Bryobacterales bacterium]|nr:hypothetical protein [Bryobacterales bacterium]
MPPRNADPATIAKLLATYEEKKGRDVAFIEAARWGALDDVVRLHQAGVNVNCRGSNNETALGTAAFAAQVAVVRFLLTHGADVSRSRRSARGGGGLNAGTASSPGD